MVRLKHVALALVFLCIPAQIFADDAPVTRRDGFLLMWETIKRPAEPAKTRFSDVPEPAVGSLEIDYAASRGIIDDSEELFRPDDALLLRDALILLFRTRNVVDDPEEVQEDTLGDLLARYPVAHFEEGTTDTITRPDLERIIGLLDQKLKDEVHEVSLYAEKFHGDGTAFGEKFDMHALTAAHRSFPHNTMVKVTNVENGKSVIVRINDRGPYVQGRNMDLSLAAFTTIAERSRGHVDTRFERLGDSRLIGMTEEDQKVPTEQSLPEPEEKKVVACTTDAQMQRRLSRGVLLSPGIPEQLDLGQEIEVTAERSFVVRQVMYPNGMVNRMQDFVLKGESFSFKPSIEGAYTFLIGPANARARRLVMHVVACGQ